MTEKRLIDANVPIRDLTAMKSMYDAISLDGMIKALKEAPTVDAVPVVRCRDCVYCKDNAVCLRKAKRGGYHSIDRVHANFYCAAGKRRGEE